MAADRKRAVAIQLVLWGALSALSTSANVHAAPVLLLGPNGTSPAPAPPMRRDGYWFAVGNKIVDESGRVVMFSGINLNGFDSQNCVMDGLWGNRKLESYIAQMKRLGFNLVRLNFASTCIALNNSPRDNSVDYGTNPDLEGLSTLEVMDKVVNACKANGIKVILSNIRLAPAAPPFWDADPGVWFNEDFPEYEWINNWKMLAQRYAKNPTVVGADIFNEVHNHVSHPNPVWDRDGVGEPYNWRTAAKRAADAIHKINPGLLIFVQGMSGESTWWGADLTPMGRYPLKLSVPNKLVYSIHEYGRRVHDQPWFHTPGYPGNMPRLWDASWGFIVKEGIAPVWVGEWGSFFESDSKAEENVLDVAWARAFRSYIRENGLSWTWFTWGPNSKDTGGILEDDWATPNAKKMTFLLTIMHPDFGPSKEQGITKAPPHPPLPLLPIINEAEGDDGAPAPVPVPAPAPAPAPTPAPAPAPEGDDGGDSGSDLPPEFDGSPASAPAPGKSSSKRWLASSVIMGIVVLHIIYSGSVWQ